MAPRRPEASEPGKQVEGSEPVKQAEGSEPGRQEQVVGGGADRESIASSAAALPGPVTEGAEGAEEVQETPEDAKERRRIRRALRSQAAGSGCTDKLEEALAELKSASAERQEAREEGRRDLEALQRELAWLQSAERQHLRISELLVLSSRDRSSVRAEACSMAEQGTMLLVEELQRGLSEAESISRSVAEEVLSHSEEEVQRREELGALRSQLMEEEEEAARVRFREEAAHDEVAALTSELESLREREAAAAEECRLSSERAAEESREQPFTPKMKHTAPKETTADEEVAEVTPAWREGPPKVIGTVAELVASLFGSTDRPLRAEDLALLSTSALASLRLSPELAASPKSADGPLCCNLYDESDSELETATGNMELDRTMEWFMGTEDAASSWQACDGSAVDGQLVGEQLLSEAGEEDEDLEWDADAKSLTIGDVIAVGELMADLAVLLGLEATASTAHPGWTGADDASIPCRGADATVVVDGVDNGPGLEEHQPPEAPETSLEKLPKEKKPKEKRPKEKPPREKPPKENPPTEELPEEKLLEETLPVEKLPKEKPPKERPPKGKLPEESQPVAKLPEEKLPDEKLPEEKPPEQAPPEQTLPEQAPEQTHSIADLQNVDAAMRASGDAAAQEPASDGGAPQHADEEEPFKMKVKEPARKSTVDGPETEENCTASQSIEAAVPAAQAEGPPAVDVPAVKELDTPVESQALPDPPVAEAPPPLPEAPAEPALPKDAKLWQVVGGADFGGIRAREGMAMHSEFLLDRLATGALVMEIELNGERLHYSKIKGDGPARGWVTVRIPGKELLVRVPHPEEEEAQTESSREAIKEEFEAYQQQCARHPLKEDWLQALQERSTRLDTKLRALILQKAPVDLVDSRGATALSKAVAWKDRDVVEMLVSYSARPEWPPQKSALELAAKMPMIGAYKAIVEALKPARQRELRREELQAQAGKGKSGEAALQLLLAANARCSNAKLQREWEEDLNSLDQGGMTVLHRCLFTNASLRIVGALLEARADVEALDKNGEAPLFLAVRQARGALLCSFLLDARAQLLQPNPKGQTVLDLASCRPGEAGEELLSALLNYATLEWWAEFEALAKQEPSRLDLPPPVKAKPPRVSVICPTLPSRGRFHRQLWTSFTCQSYPDKELVVVDTGPEPSAFFSSEPVASDERLVYKWHKDEDKFDPKNPEAGHGAHSIGSKRNIAVRAATGSIIAHFDDDDFYGPGYLDQMVALLLRHGAHAVKLSSWFVFECSTGRTGYCDPELDRLNVDDVSVDEFIWGYGFSYVYQRRVALRWGFPNVTMGEDYDFILKLQKEGCSVCLWPDLDGICLHVQHGRNTSTSLCAESVPRCVVETSMDVAGCETLAEELAKCPETAADDPNSVIMATPGTRRSSLLGLAREIMDKRFHLRGCKAVGPLGQAVLEARGLSDHRGLDAASPAAQIDRELRLDIVLESRAAAVPCLVPWSATIGEAKSITAKHLGLRQPVSRLMLRDAEQTLQDDQLLLGRRFLQLSLK